MIHPAIGAELRQGKKWTFSLIHQGLLALWSRTFDYLLPFSFTQKFFKWNIESWKFITYDWQTHHLDGLGEVWENYLKNFCKYSLIEFWKFFYPDRSSGKANLGYAKNNFSFLNLPFWDIVPLKKMIDVPYVMYVYKKLSKSSWTCQIYY